MVRTDSKARVTRVFADTYTELTEWCNKHDVPERWIREGRDCWYVLLYRPVE